MIERKSAGAGAGARASRPAIQQLVPLVIAAALWEYGVRSGALNPLYFPPLGSIASEFAGLLRSGTLPYHAALTVARMAGGLALASAVMIPVGLLMGYFRSVRQALYVTLEFFRAIPPPAVVPLALVALGLGSSMNVAVVAFGCSWPILINTMDGVRHVDTVLLRSAQMFRYTPREILLKIILPFVAPRTLAGIRISLSIALILAVTSEMVGGNDGLGYLILRAQRTFHVTQMYAGLVALSLLGYAVNFVYRRQEERLVRW